MQYLTPYFALIEIGKVKKGEYVLVPAGSSSAGLGTIQLLKCAGAKIIAKTRTKEKAAFLYNSGADYVVIMNEQSLSDRNMKLQTIKVYDLYLTLLVVVF